MDEDREFREYLVKSGAVEEILRVLVGLGESSDKPDDSLPYVLEHLGRGTLPPLVSRTSGGSSYEVVNENRYLRSRVADLKAEIKSTRTKLKSLLPEGTLMISKIAAYGVPDVDAKGGLSDPYVRVSLLDVPNLDEDDEDGEQVTLGREMDPAAFAEYCKRHGIAAQTSVVQNATDPVWEDEVLSIVLPAGTPRPPRVLVRVWDDDVSKSDDPLASAELQLEPLRGSFEKVTLHGRDGLPDIQVDFTYEMAECDARQEMFSPREIA